MRNKKRNDKYDFSDILAEQDVTELTEQDFYPPSDDRCWKSNVRDIADGDNFADFCEDFFELLEEEEYFED